MNPQGDASINTENEINLYDYWKVIVKRKKLIIGLFLISIVTAATISLLMPKIYRGEFFLKLSVNQPITKEGEFTLKLTAKEFIEIMGKADGERLKNILPKTYHLVSDIKLNALKNSTDKLQIIIDAKKTDDIPKILSEIIEYINNHFLVKRYVEQQREKLLQQSEELSKTIDSSKELLKTYVLLLKREKLIPIGFNPLELNRKISDLKIETIEVEQAIRNLKGVEIIGQFISNKPVKPKKKQMVAIAGITSLFTGIFLAFFVEYIEKIKPEMAEKNAPIAGQAKEKGK